LRKKNNFFLELFFKNTLSHNLHKEIENMDEIETEIDEHIKKNEYVEDLESGNYTYGEKINYVAISPNGSIVAKFNPCKLYLIYTLFNFSF
jgi:hypothetical protein